MRHVHDHRNDDVDDADEREQGVGAAATDERYFEKWVLFCWYWVSLCIYLLSLTNGFHSLHFRERKGRKAWIQSLRVCLWLCLQTEPVLGTVCIVRDCLFPRRLAAVIDILEITFKYAWNFSCSLSGRSSVRRTHEKVRRSGFAECMSPVRCSPEFAFFTNRISKVPSLKICVNTNHVGIYSCKTLLKTFAMHQREYRPQKEF